MDAFCHPERSKGSVGARIYIIGATPGTGWLFCAKKRGVIVFQKNFSIFAAVLAKAGTDIFR